ncbi:MAG: HlyD family efflux transporter periplasmic adaptor subunit [Rubrivivax sp.]|nr:HlyD family efflux transporter periplasmic adaptor subunit [Rubrivivax sp.]
MQRRTLLWTAAAAAAAIALLAWAFAPRPIEVEAARAAVGRFELTVDEDGRTRLPDRYVVSAPLAGRLARITLREGDAVAAGDLLATLTPALAPMLDERSVREAQARVGTAEAALARAGVRIERARVGIEQARVELQRSEKLARDGFVAPTKLDADRLAQEAAQKEHDTAVQERHVAEHELEQARAVLTALRQPAAGAGTPGAAATARGFAVRAPVAGQVLRVVQPSEATVNAGAPLVELGDLARLEVLAELLTTDALRVAAGTRVRIERWGGLGVLEGRVRRIEPAAFTKVSALGVEEQRVNVLIELASPREQWRALGDGYRVGVRLVVLAEERALQVPASAVFPLPEALAKTADGAAGGAAAIGGAGSAAGTAMATFVIADGRARLTRVHLRARNGSMAWVAGGLADGARVIVYPNATVRDGVRVRERRV